MILMKDIIKEGNEILRTESADVKLPLSNEDKYDEDLYYNE